MYPYKNLLVKKLKGETWKDIPSLEGSFQLSCYGRIKALEKWVEQKGTGGSYLAPEKIIKTYSRKGLTKTGLATIGKLRGHAFYKGKHYSIPVHRLVYYLFVKKFNLNNKTLTVSCRDEDTFNVCPENLMLTNLSDIIKEVYKKGRRPRTCYGSMNMVVSQYNLDGDFLKTFASLTLAEKETGIDLNSIRNALGRKDKYGNGFMWIRGEARKLKLKVPESVRARKKNRDAYIGIVSQYNRRGRRIHIYGSVKEAAASANVKSYRIRQVIDGSRVFAGHCHWIKGKGPSHANVDSMVQAIKEKRKKAMCVPVTQYTLAGKRRKIYKSITDAARALNVQPETISAAVRPGKKKLSTSSGFFWKRGEGPAVIKAPGIIKRSGR